jgi:hypothetical protein
MSGESPQARRVRVRPEGKRRIRAAKVLGYGKRDRM